MTQKPKQNQPKKNSPSLLGIDSISWGEKRPTQVFLSKPDIEIPFRNKQQKITEPLIIKIIKKEEVEKEVIKEIPVEVERIVEREKIVKVPHIITYIKGPKQEESVTKKITKPKAKKSTKKFIALDIKNAPQISKKQSKPVPPPPTIPKKTAKKPPDAPLIPAAPISLTNSQQMEKKRDQEIRELFQAENKDKSNQPDHKKDSSNFGIGILQDPQFISSYKEGYLKKIKKLNKLRRKSKRKTYIARIVTACFLTALIPAALFWGLNPGLLEEKLGYKIEINKAEEAVAGVVETVFESQEEEVEYKKWSQDKAQKELDPTLDEDDDGLLNLEEFYLDTDPTKAKSCDKNTDSENLFDFINPKTCEPIDPENEEEMANFSKVINIPHVHERFQESINESDTETLNSNSLYEVFGVSDIKQISLNQEDKLENNLNTVKLQQEYIETINKIDNYIKKYRSYGPYDRDYDEPVHPATYLEVSLKYNTPLKYVLTIARLESRFGTDRFTSTGAPTRIHKYENIYSMGLDDSGNNMSFGSWEGSVESFGKWYQRFEEKGVSDCSKWRIYNPNGDYCSKVESVAADIEMYLKD